MKELECILREHAEKYPLMQPQDAVKLIYQNEFGCGHMVKDPDLCLARLREEYAVTTKEPSVPLFEPIGNGFFRVHLHALPPDELDLLGQAFLRTAAEYQGSMPQFLRKLDVLLELTECAIFSFSTNELNAYLDDYKKAGCPVVSHSQTYRLAYSPAYRIIRK